MSKKRIILLVHESLIPPMEKKLNPDRFDTPWITEYDVVQSLLKLGHEIQICGLLNDLSPLERMIEEFKPHHVFNLLEEFAGNPRDDFKVVSYLDLKGISYTGCNPKGLLLARDKALSKKILSHHKIGTANFYTLPKNKKRKVPKNLKFPLIVKCLYEEASYGIAKASVVHSPEKLRDRVEFIHQNLDQDAIIEEFIPGREIYVGIIGNKKLSNLPLWELSFDNVDDPDSEIYSSRAKWNEKYRKRKGINSGPAKLEKALEDKIIKTCKKVYQVLELSGYARIDLRMKPDGKIYILEANPNPNIASDDEFAKSAEHQGIKYNELIKSLLP